MPNVHLELFTQSIPETGHAERMAERAEAGGWDGLSLTDSQNLVGDPFVAMALGAKVTERLKFMTGVTNPATRHPAALATVIATVQEVSRGRAVLGIGRGDTALFHLGRPPMPVDDFFARIRDVHAYLHGQTVDLHGHPSRLRWLDRAQQPTVPVDIAASGPKVIAFAARTVEQVTFAVGANPDRMTWALQLARAELHAAARAEGDVSFGAYVNVGCHPDRGAARDLIRGSIAAFAHFSAMPGSTGAGLDTAIVRSWPKSDGDTTAICISRTRPTTRMCSRTSSSIDSPWSGHPTSAASAPRAGRARARTPRDHRSHDRRRPGAGAPEPSSRRRRIGAGAARRNRGSLSRPMTLSRRSATDGPQHGLATAAIARRGE